MRVHGNLTNAKRANRTRDGPVFSFIRNQLVTAKKVSNKKIIRS